MSVKKLLRLEDEEYVYFDELQIHNLLVENSSEFLEYLKKFYINWSEDKSLVNLPKKQVFQSQQYKGDFRVMPCIIDSKNIKSVKIIGTNEENRVIKDKICVGKSFLIDPYDNYIYAMFDVCALSSFRTAAISVLAYDMLTQSDKTKIAIVGLGRIGFYTALILYKWLGIKEFYCCEINDTNLNNFMQLVSIYMPDAEIKMRPVDDLQKDCDSVFVATDSNKALLNVENSNCFSFISSVGADANNLSELDKSILENRIVVTDSIQSMMLGDLNKWEDMSMIDKEDVMELNAIKDIDNFVNKNILFISTGIAVQDALISQFIFDKLSNKQ